MSETSSPTPSEIPGVRIAVASSRSGADPRDPQILQAGGAQIRQLITEAHRQQARLVHFGEGALCFPSKRIMSSDPDRVAAADWSRVAWDSYRAELDAIAELAGRLRIWVAIPAAHRLSDTHRPHNSMYVIDDHGRVHTRYDERWMSETKVRFMYTPGTEPITFTLDGLRIGCALGVEAAYAQSFAEYERLGADLVLFSTGDGASRPDQFVKESEVHARINGYWLSLASTLPGTSMIIGPNGDPVAEQPSEEPSVVVADVTSAVDRRPWLERLRSGIYEQHLVEDSRSVTRTSF